MLFNKPAAENRIEEVLDKIRGFGWTPRFANWYDIKGDKGWWVFCFPKLKTVSNEDAWAKIPAEMEEYIRSLPEFDEEVWQKLTGV